MDDKTDSSFNESVYLSPMSPSDSVNELYSTASCGSFTQDMRGDSTESEELEEFDKKLPDTVTLLVGPNCSKVYLIGTSHFSLESQNDVSRVIQTVKPHAVVVELCKSRANIIEMDEQAILSEAQNLSLTKARHFINEAGVLQGVLYILLLKLSAKLTKNFGIAPGGEFRKALEEINKLNGCVLFFGDRPLRVTIKRTLARLNLKQLVCMFFSLLFAKTDDLSIENIEEYKKKDVLSRLTETLVQDYPELSDTLINERDIYLTRSLQFVASKQFVELNKGVVPTRVVGVVGIGHCQGIEKHWGKVITDKDIIPLLTIPEPPLSVRIACSTVKIGFTCLLVYGCYRLFRVQRLISYAKVYTLSLPSLSIPVALSKIKFPLIK